MERREYDRIFEVEDSFWWYRGLRRIMLTLATPFLPKDRPISILDAGCGTGGFLEDLARRGHPTALDISDRALELVRRRGGYDAVRAGVEAIPIASESMDLIVSMDVLYHRAVTDDGAALGEMVRCLRPGGIVCVNLPAYSWLTSAHDRVIHTARRYTRARVEALCAPHPLRILRLSHWNSILFPAVAAARLVTKNRGGSESDVRPLPAPVNAALEGVLAVESFLLRRVSFAAGLSIALVAQRTEEP